MKIKLILIFGLFCLSFSMCGQTTNNKITKPLTLKYAGTYSYGKDIEKGRVGTIVIYPETDSTVLFYIDVNRGAPSYNMGSLYGRVKIINDNGLFYTKFYYEDIGCKWTFKFSKNKLTIKTVDDQYGCGFGHAVYADGEFKKISNVIPNYFEDMHSTKVFFKDITPEDYYKNMK